LNDIFYREQLKAHGVSNINWTSDIDHLLGFDTLARRCKIEEKKTEETKYRSSSK
jgi:hypothetical protein